jgi:hypothetical protein
MSAGEKLVDRAMDIMERDHNSGPVVRRALWHGAIGAMILTVALAVCIGTFAHKTGLADAFEGGALAKDALPQITSDIDALKLDMAAAKEGIKILIGFAQRDRAGDDMVAVTQAQACADMAVSDQR